MVQLERLLPVMQKVYQMTYRKEIEGEKVDSKDKIFSIYEQHTDIIVKGGRNVEFGHKINLTTGKTNLILTCETPRGNPSDSKLYTGSIDKVKQAYGAVPRDIATDGSYASLENLDYAQSEGIVNVVFNKTVGSLKSQSQQQEHGNQAEKMA
jgi:IS5 family transposase